MVKLFIPFSSLFLHVVGEYLKVSIVSDGIGIVSACPEIAAPQKGLHFRVGGEDVLCGDAFDLFDGVKGAPNAAHPLDIRS